MIGRRRKKNFIFIRVKFVFGLGVREMEQLEEAIELHIDLDWETPLCVQYWEAVLVVCEWELAEARKREAMEKARVR
ncbi:hypothetical protein CQW23_20119 [Capsicum baccatum]|uniref:Splicing factor cactin central domain-containing protein n=1 Tax=Capsicum baccatum TaxID=33114 RepID=A0A2G2W7Q3_CAPBA|nr:hypothetical protein CQW23_20119 [Capsicum baccatum]